MHPLLRWLGHPRASRRLTFLALLFASPALAGGLALDDYVIELLVRGDRGIAGFHPSPLFGFSFTSGRPEDNRALMDQGALLPWWTDEHHLNAFLRPLSSLLHGLDFALFPHAPWLMHVHSLLWFLLLLFVLGRVYRALGVGTVATCTLAFGFFALDGSHGMTLSWLANRNALVATALALPALLAHHRFVAHGARAGALLGPLCFALGLCGGETALAVLGYILAYTVVLDRGKLSARAAHLLPYLLVLFAWRAAFSALGLGSAGSGAYHDPAREPLGYALALVDHLPVLLSTELALPLSDVWFWGPPEVHLPVWVLSVAGLLPIAAAGHVLLRHDDEARFWGLGMVLSSCAVAASVPGGRLLLVPSIGGAAFLAKLVSALLPDRSRARPRWAEPLLGAMMLLHAVVGPLSLPVQSALTGLLGSAIARAERGIPTDPSITSRTVVVVNAPFDVLVSYVQVGRQALGMPRPSHLYWLATASSPITLTTLDERSVEVRPDRGFLLTSPERHYRGDPSALGKGARVSLPGMEVEVLEVTADGRPQAARMRFPSPLRSPEMLLLRYDRGALVPFALPPRGQSVRMPREDVVPALIAEAASGLRGP